MNSTSRRRFLEVALAAQAAEIAVAHQHARTAASSRTPVLVMLGAAEARELEALASQIIPSASSPGAREAGVIYFIDKALETFDREKREAYRRGLEAAQVKRRELFPASESIAALDGGQHIALLRAIESTEFFGLLRTHTVMGFLGNPEYGGNRDLIGWKLIGFEDAARFEPPFGYYDREERR
ncbi:MAG: gluconate 2-dehydrogenase subunit 3 family protein [Acidobacteria bacterium]|nr:gluconate 2-dehydrogenase subunit 3 family protein [Acidobacteriota bacterium]